MQESSEFIKALEKSIAGAKRKRATERVTAPAKPSVTNASNIDSSLSLQAVSPSHAEMPRAKRIRWADDHSRQLVHFFSSNTKEEGSEKRLLIPQITNTSNEKVVVESFGDATSTRKKVAQGHEDLVIASPPADVIFGNVQLSKEIDDHGCESISPNDELESDDDDEFRLVIDESHVDELAVNDDNQTIAFVLPNAIDANSVEDLFSYSDDASSNEEENTIENDQSNVNDCESLKEARNGRLGKTIRQYLHEISQQVRSESPSRFNNNNKRILPVLQSVISESLC